MSCGNRLMVKDCSRWLDQGDRPRVRPRLVRLPVGLVSPKYPTCPLSLAIIATSTIQFLLQVLFPQSTSILQITTTTSWRLGVSCLQFFGCCNFGFRKSLPLPYLATPVNILNKRRVVNVKPIFLPLLVTPSFYPLILIPVPYSNWIICTLGCNCTDWKTVLNVRVAVETIKEGELDKHKRGTSFRCLPSWVK